MKLLNQLSEWFLIGVAIGYVLYLGVQAYHAAQIPVPQAVHIILGK